MAGSPEADELSLVSKVLGVSAVFGVSGGSS